MSGRLHVIVGVSGGIAAIKVPELVRRLREAGHSVRCAMTHSAAAFVTPLSLEVLTEHAVYRQEYLEANHSGEELHVSVARWADVMAVVPATCHTIARLSLGLADDFLATTALAFSGPLLVAPAMDTVMWEKQVVQDHLQVLRERQVRIVGPVKGALATGESGMGRMVEPLEIVAEIEAAAGGGSLAGTTVLVTAGPTREALDPVRFLSNRSSGRMGFALAEEAAARGARCLLVTGPVDLPTPRGVERCDVTTALQMQSAVFERAPAADLIVMTAAVSDFRPKESQSEKIKKQAGVPHLELTRNPDILAGLADVAPAAIRVGFAAETREVDAGARTKLESKRAAFIVANDVSRSDIGFDSRDNEVTVFRRTGKPIALPRQSKRRISKQLMDLFEGALKDREAALVEGPG